MSRDIRGHSGKECRHSCSRPFRLAVKSGLYRPIAVVKRREIDSMACSNGLHLLNPLGSDASSSLREGFEPALQRKRHAFEQASMDHIGERMPIQNSTEIRCEPQSASDLSQNSKENLGAWHLGG